MAQPPANKPLHVTDVPPDRRRGAAPAKASGCAAVAVVVAIICSIGLFVFWWDSRLELVVTNHAAAPADVAILAVSGAPVYDPDGPIPATAREVPLVGVTGVAAGRTASARVRPGADVDWSAVRVRVGGVTYEGAGATLLDHHGPHRYAVDVYPDHVVLTHRTSRRSGTRELRRTSPATASAGRGGVS